MACFQQRQLYRCPAYHMPNSFCCTYKLLNEASRAATEFNSSGTLASQTKTNSPSDLRILVASPEQTPTIPNRWDSTNLQQSCSSSSGNLAVRASTYIIWHGVLRLRHLEFWRFWGFGAFSGFGWVWDFLLFCEFVWFWNLFCILGSWFICFWFVLLLRFRGLVSCGFHACSI